VAVLLLISTFQTAPPVNRFMGLALYGSLYSVLFLLESGAVKKLPGRRITKGRVRFAAEQVLARKQRRKERSLGYKIQLPKSQKLLKIVRTNRSETTNGGPHAEAIMALPGCGNGDGRWRRRRKKEAVARHWRTERRRAGEEDPLRAAKDKR